MNTLITFRQGRVENIMHIDVEPMSPALAPAFIADSDPVILNIRDLGYMGEVIVEIGHELRNLEDEYLETSPYCSKGCGLFNMIKELKLAAAWLEMEMLRLRAEQRLNEAHAGAM
ncbi:MAG: hypothetical protein ACRCWB_11665 [Enterovibrio sp.]